jgi:hypothetical protein
MLTMWDAEGWIRRPGSLRMPVSSCEILKRMVHRASNENQVCNLRDVSNGVLGVSF